MVFAEHFFKNVYRNKQVNMLLPNYVIIIHGYLISNYA